MVSLSADPHCFLRTCINAERPLVDSEPVPAQITLEHDPSANRQKFLPEGVYTNSSLALGNVPGADRAALGTAEAEILVNIDRSLSRLMFDPKGQSLAQGGLSQCIQRRGIETVFPSISTC